MKKIINRTEQFFWGTEKILNHPHGGLSLKIENENAETDEGPIVKITTTEEPASIQVCPSEKLAMSMGYRGLINTKSIFVLEAKPGAYLYLGIKTNDRATIEKAIADNTFEDLLIKVEVRMYGFYNIPAGLIHGLGAGIKMVEVSKPSVTSFRIYDYNRERNGKPVILKQAEAINSIDPRADYRLNSATTLQPTYKNAVGSVIHMTKPTMVFAKCILVDLDTETSYIVEEETVSFKNYLLISMK